MNPVVDDEGCSTLEIHEVLKKCGSSYELLLQKLVELSRALRVPVDTIRTVKKYVNEDIGTSSEIIHTILSNWRAKVSHNATIRALSTALEKIGLLHCAVSLRQHFRVQLYSDENFNPTICHAPNEVGTRRSIIMGGKFEKMGVAVKRVLMEPIDFAEPEMSLLKESVNHKQVIRWLSPERCERMLYTADADTLNFCKATVQDWVEGKYVNQSVDPIRLLREATEGLAHLHSLRIVHGEVKMADETPERVVLPNHCEPWLREWTLNALPENPPVLRRIDMCSCIQSVCKGGLISYRDCFPV